MGCKKQDFVVGRRSPVFGIIAEGVQGFKGSGFKVAISPLDCIWNADLRQKRMLRQAQFKIWSQIGNYLGK